MLKVQSKYTILMFVECNKNFDIRKPNIFKNVGIIELIKSLCYKILNLDHHINAII